MRNHEVDAKNKAVGGSAAANGAAASKRRKRRSWGVEDKIRVARESFATDETVASVARRYGISRYRLSSWRSLLRRGKLVAPSSAQAGQRWTQSLDRLAANLRWYLLSIICCQIEQSSSSLS